MDSERNFLHGEGHIDSSHSEPEPPETEWVVMPTARGKGVQIKARAVLLTYQGLHPGQNSEADLLPTLKWK